MRKSIIATALLIIMSLVCLTGCGMKNQNVPVSDLADGGVLVLSVNPEIAVEYDENGVVTAVNARNNDAIEIIDSCSGLIGQEARTTVSQLVKAIGEAGYFIEEIDGEKRQIVLEIEAGSSLPHDSFLDDVVSDIRDCVNKNNWQVPMDVENESDYGLTDYEFGTDYGNTDYDSATDYGKTDYDSESDYGNTDYDSETDYGKTDYDSESDYGNTDYDSESDYGNTDYDSESDYGNTDYDSNSDYGVSDYDGESDYD